MNNIIVCLGDRLYAVREFDREKQKSYLVYISITDNGIPPMTGVSELKVIIGDVNDNAMKPGSSEIFVNSNPVSINVPYQLLLVVMFDC